MLSQSGMALPPNTGSPVAGNSPVEEFEADDDISNLTPASTQWPASPLGSSSTASQLPRAAPPMQKRRRVTRACDECRRKKIKCDGKQPCTHCTVYSYECTFDQPSNRRRNPTPQYIEALENRLQRAEALLQTFLPDIDVNDSNFDSILQQRRKISASDTTKLEQTSVTDVETHQDAQLRSMIETTGQLDLDDNGHWDFHGGSSGAVFLKRMREQFGGLLGSDTKTPFLPRPPRPDRPFLDSPRSADSPLEFGLPNTLDLPSREVALELCDTALHRACALLRFVHEPTFFEMFNRIYSIPAENFTNEEHRFLPLLYVILALGCMFTDDAPSLPHVEEATYKAGMDQGVKYYNAARQMMDVTDCRDLTSLQAILFMILFLQSSSNLSTCYSYIGVALRSALRMGLHRKLSTHFNPVDRETRRRIFWIIRKMDTYVGAMLGFPRMLSDDDIDQELPIELDDEYITKDGILPMPPGKISVFAANNAHTRLMGSLAKVIKYIYPIKGVEQSVQGAEADSYAISHAKIKEIECDLQEWLDELPMALRPGGDAREEIIRLQQLLRMAYAHVQMMLYRPFLHYASKKSSAAKTFDERSYACAAAGVSVSRNIVHITAEMQKRGLLIGSYWFTMYTTFFAILSLVFFVLENPEKPGSSEILADAEAGRDSLKVLARRSMAADRCSASLNGLFEQLPEKLKNGKQQNSKKRRSAPPINSGARGGARSSPDSIISAPNPGVQRVSTFPTTVKASGFQNAGLSRQAISFDSPHFQASPIMEPSLRHNFQELVSPTDLSAVGTPDSGSSGSMQPFNYAQPFGSASNGLPDLGAMMFPSADPFAYPNQPMIDFDNRQQKNDLLSSNLLDSGSMSQNMYVSNGGPTQYDSLEGQLFGPLPPYLMQSHTMDMSQMNMTIPTVNHQDMSRLPGMTTNAGVCFDEIFAGGNDDWNNMLSDQIYRQ